MVLPNLLINEKKYRNRKFQEMFPPTFMTSLIFEAVRSRATLKRALKTHRIVYYNKRHL